MNNKLKCQLINVNVIFSLQQITRDGGADVVKGLGVLTLLLFAAMAVLI